MPKFAVVSIADPQATIAGPFTTPFLPQPGKPITVRTSGDVSGRKALTYMLVDLLRYELITDAPEESGAVYSGHEIR
ncbi:MAG TPA: hypothetical protein VI172_17030 [Candidatus Dormibacteraeota bacterium]|jgi:hypothetical protein